MEYDFLIITQPRSGSHMLATALNGHSQISCTGEIRNPRDFIKPTEGEILGGILHYSPEGDITAKKYIYMKRDITERSRSVDRLHQIKHNETDPKFHFLEPKTLDVSSIVYKQSTFDICKERTAQLEEFLLDKDHITVTYEEITGNKSITEIPEAVGRKITEYLGVKYEPLKPLTVKPTIITK